MRFIIGGIIDLDGNQVVLAWSWLIGEVMHLHTDAIQKVGLEQLEELKK